MALNFLKKPLKNNGGDENFNLEPVEKKDQEEKKEQISQKEKWLEPKGELAIDLYETENEFVVEAPIAGVKREEIEILIENDILKIRGERKRRKKEKIKKYLIEECFWGKFSREIIFPQEIDGSRAEAVFENGILIIQVPKIQKKKRVKLELK